MKRLFKRGKQVIKGTSSGVIISILLHGGLIAVAIVFVVIPHVKRSDQSIIIVPQTEPLPIPIAKPQPPSQNPSEPPSAAHIVVKVDQVTPSAIQFPSMLPGGDSPGVNKKGGVEVEFPSFPMIGDNCVPFGTTNSIGNDLKGTYYDFKRTRTGSYNGTGVPGEQTEYIGALNNFLKNWDLNALDSFYRAPQKRYTPCIMVPTLNSDVAPTAFSEDRASGLYWMVHYQGEIVYPEDITFRFWGAGDFFLGVRLDQKVVFFTAWQTERDLFSSVKWMSSDSQRDIYYIGGADSRLDVGEWITLKANEPKEIEIVLGDNGGLAGFALLVEVKGTST